MLSKAQLTERNRQIVELLRETKPNGEYRNTYQEIGDAYGLTRERVRQIGKRSGNADRHIAYLERQQVIRDNAPECATEHCSNKVRIIETPSLRYSTTGRCVDHRRDMVLITCAYCGKESERERYQVHTDHRIDANPFRSKPQTKWFCNNKCQGQFIAREYGFIAHPENRKYDTGTGGQRTYRKRGKLYGVPLADLKASANEA